MAQRFSGMTADDVGTLRQLEQENARLKKLLAERDLEIKEMKDIAAKKWSAHPSAASMAKVQTLAEKALGIMPPREGP